LELYFTREYWSSKFWEEHADYRTHLLDLQIAQSSEPAAMIPGSAVPLCAQGDFENGNSLFTVEYSSFSSGSNNCIAANSIGIWSVPSLATLSSHMDLVTAGADPNVPGLSQTHSGNGALRINSTIGISGSNCSGNYGAQVDRARATMVIDASTLQLSFWYAIVMQNPGHTNSNPFVTIRAVNAVTGIMYDALCYDPSQNNMLSTVNICNSSASLWQPWTCGTFNFPTSAIGETIYFDVIVADCGLGGHLAYAYLDDICGSCSATGNDGDITVALDSISQPCFKASFNGTFTLPANQANYTTDISVQLKHNNLNVGPAIIPIIDLVAQTYSFTIPPALYLPNTCYDVVATATFSIGGLPVSITNTEVNPGLDNDFCVPQDTTCCPTVSIKTACDTDLCYANNIYLYVEDQNGNIILSNQNPYTITWKLLPTGPTYTNMSYLPITNITQHWEVTVTDSLGCVAKDTLNVICCEQHTVEIVHVCPLGNSPCDTTFLHPLRVKVDGVLVDLFGYANNAYTYTLKWFELIGTSETQIQVGPMYIGNIRNRSFILELTDQFGCIIRDTINFCCYPETTVTVNACDTYTWATNGTTYVNSGTYMYFDPQDTCVKYKLNLSLGQSTTSSTAVSACDSYFWAVNGNTYTVSGTYTYVTTNSTGCSHTETLNLTINYSTSTSTTQNACNSFTWACNGITYNNSGVYVCTSINSAGCLHTETLNLTIQPTSGTTTTVNACDTYTWVCNANTYTVSGTYTCNTISANGCIETNTLHLTINNSTSNTTAVTACDNYTWAINGFTYTSSGTYTYTSVNTTGCTHVETLVLTITQGQPTNSVHSQCGGSYTWPANGMTYTTSGTYTTGAGCNQQTLTLTILSLPVVTTTAINACLGGAPVILNGTPAGGVWNLPNPYNGNASSFTYLYTHSNGCTGQSTSSISYSIANVTNLIAANVTGISATIQWSAINSIAWYEIRYKQVTSAVWTTVTSNATNKGLANLIPNTTYSIEVRGFCSLATPGPWLGIQFTTNNNCGAPTGLFVNNLSSTTAKLNWAAVAGATYYTVRWKKTTLSIWNSGTTTTTSKNIAGLSTGTYEYSVRTHCGNSVTAFSPNSTFSIGAQAKGQTVEIGLEPNTFTLYPNPAHSLLNIELGTSKVSIVEIKLFDMSGRTVKQVQQPLTYGETLMTLDISDLNNGMYMVQILNEGQLPKILKFNKE
jgi:hypothetical protein